MGSLDESFCSTIRARLDGTDRLGMLDGMLTLDCIEWVTGWDTFPLVALGGLDTLDRLDALGGLDVLVGLGGLGCLTGLD